jgi:hypothetical protein
MDYKNNPLLRILFFAFLLTVMHACNEGVQKEKNIISVYYVDILNGEDSIKTGLAARVFGKVSFYKNDRITLVSKNYMTEVFPESHAYEPVNLLPAKIEPGTKKITVEFSGNFTVDSTYYAVRQFVYDKDKWNKVSDMGFIKAEARYKSEPMKNKMPVKDIVNTITLAITESTYPR